MPRAEYEKLLAAIDECEAARSCIAENRGPEKEEAREGFEHVVSEVLAPALRGALECAEGDLDGKALLGYAGDLVKRLRKAGELPAT
jgi:hypothetical protein